MNRVLLGSAFPGRYPRWGYLDRLETNDVMPRACATALAVLGLLGAVVLVAQWFWPANRPTPELERPFVKQIINPLPKPLPPPSIRVDPSTPRVSIAPPPPSAVPVPVNDAFTRNDVTWEGPRGGPSGKGVGVAWTGITESPEWSTPMEMPPLPAPDDFVPVEHEPELLFMPEPDYPDLARDAGIEGTVLIRALVGADGSVRQVLLLRGVLGLDEVALEAVAGAVFRPARQQGQPVAVWVVVPIQFTLRPC